MVPRQLLPDGIDWHAARCVIWDAQSRCLGDGLAARWIRSAWEDVEESNPSTRGTQHGRRAVLGKLMAPILKGIDLFMVGFEAS